MKRYLFLTLALALMVLLISTVFLGGCRDGDETTTTLAPVRLPAAEITDSQQRRLFAGGGQSAAFEYQLTFGAAATVHLEIAEKGTADQHGRVLARTKRAPAQTRGALLWNGMTLDDTIIAEGEYLAYVVTEDTAGNQATSRPVAVVVYEPIVVDGVVEDEAGRRVSKAEVSVADTGLSVTTEADGSFRLDSCPMGFRTFEASGAGVGSGSVRVKLNHSTGAVTVILGQTAGETASDGQAAVASGAVAVGRNTSLVTISGYLYYEDKDGVARPMRGVRVVLQDDATFCWDDLMTGESGWDGYFSFVYDYETSFNDVWNEPDVRVVAYAEDPEDDICSVKDGFWSADAHEFVATPTWSNNKSSHTDLVCTKTGDDRVAWFIYESARQAHDRWQELTGHDGSRIWVDFPADIGNKTGEFDLSVYYTCINLPQRDDTWEPETIYHEYGHFIHYDLSQVSPGCNAFAAYTNELFRFYEVAEGKWYSPKDNLTANYDTEEAGAWKALKEGFAEFFTAVISDWDRGGVGEYTFERNADVGLGTSDDKDDSRIAHSITRALWDSYDATETPLCCNWSFVENAPVAPHPLTRPMGPLGDTDDDMLANTSGGTFGSTLAKLVTVLSHDFPADVHEFYHALINRYPTDQLDHTALQAVFYSQGILKDHPVESAPQVVDTVITPVSSVGAYRGTVRVYAKVNDMNGPRDLDRTSVRLEWGNVGTAWVDWSPLGCTYMRLHHAPQGEYGDNWYAIDWDTRAPSPCTTRFSANKAFGYETNGSREGTAIAGRKENVRLRVIANDRFTDSAPVELAPITVDNTPGPFGDQAIADTRSDHIAWAGMETITNTPYTYELFFTPGVLRAGIIAEYTLGYIKPLEGRAPIMRIELTDDGRVRFSVNKYDGSGPGGGTWCYPYDPRDPTRLEVGRRYHIAANDGPWGIRLYIDGRLEAAAPYLDFPQPDWSDETLYGGWFSIGAYETLPTPDSTATGLYDEVRVSNVQRYTGDAANPFTPPSTPFTSDANTVLLDHLDGATTGENNGMTFGP